MTHSSTLMTLKRLEEILGCFSGLTIGLVGDLFLDRYLEVDTKLSETSIETGLEAYQVSRVNNQPGALGTVMNNLAALGIGRMLPVTVIGEDGHGYDLLKSLQHLPVDTRYVTKSPVRLTPTYTKPIREMVGGNLEELNRFDVRTRASLDPTVSHLVSSHLERLFQETDGIIVLDQINETNWGVINEGVRNTLGQLCKMHPEKLVFVDSRKHLHEFSYGVLKGNEAELRATGNEKCCLEDSMQRIHEITGRPVYCTRGEDGILVSTSHSETVQVPGFGVAGPVDIVGAGDSATSGIVASLLVGADAIEAAIVGNLVASVTVQKIGITGTATPDELVARYQEVIP